MSLQTNLAAYWKFEENTGTTINDATALNAAATFGGTTGSQWVAGKLGYGLSFNGTDNKVPLATNVGSFILSSNFSIAAWVNPTLNSTNQVIYGNAIGAGDPGYHMRITTANKARMICITNNSIFMGMDSSVLSAGWNFLVGQWNGSTASIYVNGVLDNATTVSQDTMSSLTTTNVTCIGAESDASLFFTGTIDELGVWSKLLSANDVQALYNGGFGNAYPFKEFVINNYQHVRTTGGMSVTEKIR